MAKYNITVTISVDEPSYTRAAERLTTILRELENYLGQLTIEQTAFYREINSYPTLGGQHVPVNETPDLTDVELELEAAIINSEGKES